MKPVLIFDDTSGLTALASEFGFPTGLFPARMRLREGRLGKPRWFHRKGFDEKGNCVFTSGPLTLLIIDDQSKKEGPQ